MTRKRSEYARQRKYVSRLVSKNSHRDYRKSESVNILTEADLYDALTEEFGVPHPAVIQSYNRGEIISDSRGQGSHDKQPKPGKRTWIPSKS